MYAIINAIIKALSSLWDAFKHLIIWFLDVVVGILKSIFYWFFDQLCTFVLWVINGIDLQNFSLSDFMNWAGLPPQLTYILNACGFSTCLTMVSSALLIRLLLNLIPSWATRV